MLKKLSLLLVVLVAMSFTNADKEIGGIKMPESISSSAGNLALNGAGIRTKFFMKLYVGGLYLQNKESSGKTVVNANKPMAIRLHIISSMITSEKMEDATREGFKDATNGNTANIKGQIEMFIDVFKDEIKVNDTFNLVYNPAKGVEIYKNDKLSTTINGLEFKKALFGIWLGEEPAQDSLKDEMLGE